MSILAWIVVGTIAGWLAERITGRSHGLLTNLFVGIIGAFLGGFIFSSLLGFRYEEGFNVPSIVVATVGAVVLLAIFGGIRTAAPGPECAQRRHLFAAVGIPIFGLREEAGRCLAASRSLRAGLRNPWHGSKRWAG